ncbi:MAG: outer membrane beta-barrel protein [bacterium]
MRLVQSWQVSRCAVPLICATAAIVTVAAAPVWADEEPLPNKFMLRLGGYAIQDSNTIVRLDSANAPAGAFVDFGETLGGDTRTTMVRLDSLYRFNDHHAVGFAWYNVKFTGSKVLSKDIEWGGITYPANTQVDSEIEFKVYKLNYQYSVFRNEEAELGASFGLHIMRVSTNVDASGIRESRNEATAPLPVGGLFANYNFTPRFSAYYNYQLFFISYEDKVKGTLQDFLLGLEYRLFRNVALGAAYNWFSMDMEIEKDVTTLKLDTRWNGAMLYAAVYF